MLSNLGNFSRQHIEIQITYFSYYYSPALKKWGYTGFAMSFRHTAFRDSVTAKLKCILLNNFYVYGPTSMKLILDLVSKVRKGP